MKKFTLTLLAMIFALFVVSCGDSKKDDPTDPTGPDTDTDTDTDTPDDPDSDTPEPQDPCNPNPCEDGETCEAADNAAGYTCTGSSEGCTLDASLVNSDAERYFGFKGIGKINNPNVSQPDWASLVKVALEGIDGKDLDFL